MNMMNFDRALRRLYVEQPLVGEVTLIDKAHHYVINVLRQQTGDKMLFFNGIEGEWRGELISHTKKQAIYNLELQTRIQPEKPALTFAFAPLKKERLDYLVQKAVEMGAGTLQPVQTTYTQNMKLEKLESYAIEAAEQCGILCVPTIHKALSFKSFIEKFPQDEALIFCDEQAKDENPLDVLRDISAPKTLFIGPEGGFSEDERALLLAKPFVTPISLGKNILRADTAAVAGMMVIGLC
jgi:16S rRNA (uracil1498-N3)-methyltransferase